MQDPTGCGVERLVGALCVAKLARHIGPEQLAASSVVLPPNHFIELARAAW